MGIQADSGYRIFIAKIRKYRSHFFVISVGTFINSAMVKLLTKLFKNSLGITNNRPPLHSYNSEYDSSAESVDDIRFW